VFEQIASEELVLDAPSAPAENVDGISPDLSASDSPATPNVGSHGQFEPLPNDDTMFDVSPRASETLGADALASVTKQETATDGTRVGNKYANQPSSTPLSSARQPNDSWQKNPFTDGTERAAIDPSVDQRSNQPTEIKQSSILTVSGSTQRAPASRQASTAEFQQLTPASKVPGVAPTRVSLTDTVAQQAAHHIEYGKSLSRRGASFGARQEFFAALGVVAQSNDAQTSSNAYSTALRRAIQALREVSDFVVEDAETQIGMNLANILETHSTKIISRREATQMTPVQAMQRYFTFAHQQLDFAGGQNVVTAEALFCLGKLHTVMAKHQPETLDIAKAIVFHRAALSSDSQNDRSANELGVLLARSGKLNEAESLFKQCLVIRSAPQPWQNLAKVHQRQGEMEMAELANGEFIISSQMSVADSNASHIRWVGQQEFSQLGPADFHESTASAGNNVVPASRTSPLTEEDTPKKKTIAERLEKLNPTKWF
jgi:Flp pilus assembly protein TadD